MKELKVNRLLLVLILSFFFIANNQWIGRTVSGFLNPAVEDLDLNGYDLILDADGDTYFTEQADDKIDYYSGGAKKFEIWQGTIRSVNNNCFNLGNTAQYTYAFKADLDTAFGYIAADSCAITAGGVEAMRWTEATTITINAYGNIYPGTDDSYYLGKNDDDTPFSWKGIILKDTTNGKYYRIEIINGVVTATDLTD